MFNRTVIILIGILAFVVFAIVSLNRYKKSSNESTANEFRSAIANAPSPEDSKGKAVVIPSDDVIVNSYGTWKIIYTVGKEGIAIGGGIALHISPFWGWTPPQNSNQDYPGYTTVSTSNDKTKLDVLVGYPHYIVVRIQETPLIDKQSITIIYGDTGEGKHPSGQARCDKYAEDGEEFFVKVDGDGDGHFYPIDHQPRINILSGPAAALVATAPSLVEMDTPFSVTLAAVDRYDNWAKTYQGIIRLSSSSSEIDIPREYHFKPSDGGSKRFPCTIKKAGLYRIQAEDKTNGFKTESNPILCKDKLPEYRLYWGDIHGHSGICDGTGTPDNYYQYARDVSGLDISSLTSHDAHGLIPLDEDEKTWNLIRSKTDFYYRPGEFVTFLGYEWTNWTYGHQHILFLNSAEGEVFSFRNPKSSTPKGLWECLKGKEVITIPHHVGGGPIPCDWNFYNSDFQPLTEICSVHGNCEFLGCPKGIYNPKEHHFVQDALARGYKLGVIASGDSHNGHPGRRDTGAIMGGLMGVYAESLDRASIWKAFKTRRVYGTSGARIILDFHINGQPMGDVLSYHDKNIVRDISGEVIGTGMIQEITIVKNGFDLSSVKGTGTKNNIHYLDRTMIETGDYYYFKVIQNDGEMAWSSPIWLEPQHDSK